MVDSMSFDEARRLLAAVKAKQREELPELLSTFDIDAAPLFIDLFSLKDIPEHFIYWKDFKTRHSSLTSYRLEKIVQVLSVCDAFFIEGELRERRITFTQRDFGEKNLQAAKEAISKNILFE